jgi:acetyltransferase
LKIAKHRRLELVWGTVLKENINMLALGRKLGFRSKWSSEELECELKINLKETHLEDIEVGGKF